MQAHSPITTAESATGHDARLLRLHPEDNVLTAIQSLADKSLVQIEGREIRISGLIPIGHKVAARRIPPGHKVIKYGVPIGSATQSIEPGELVHTHNLKSDYLPTYKRGEGELHAR